MEMIRNNRNNELCYYCYCPYNDAITGIYMILIKHTQEWEILCLNIKKKKSLKMQTGVSW
jgi:hypothetical protein